MKNEPCRDDGEETIIKKGKNDMEKKKFKRHEVLDGLKDGLVKISFTKSNGDVREMVCTRKFKMIPKEKMPNGKGTPLSARPNADPVIPVFDTTLKEWRSFNFDKLISFQEIE